MKFGRNLFLPILLGTVFLNGLIWMAVVPFNHAPDEFSHYSIPEFIVNKGRYPIFGKDITVVEYQGNRGVSLSTLPPLAYIIQAAAIKIGSVVVKEKNWYLLARLTSNLAILVYIYFSWKIVSLLTNNLFFKKATLIFLAFIPGVTFVSSYVNSDAWALAVSTFLIWQMVKIIKGKGERKTSILTGVGTGLVILSRLNAYILIPFAGFLIISLKRWQYFLYFLFGSAAVSGWWLWRNLNFFGEILPLTAYTKIHYSLWPQDLFHRTISQIIFQTTWAWTTFRSFWGVFDWNFLYLPEIYYFILLILMMASGIGLIRFRKSKTVLLFCLIVLASVIQSLTSSSYFSFQPQGRYLYQSLTTVVFLFNLGLINLFNKEILKKLILVFTAWGMIILNVLSMGLVILPKYYSSPIIYLSEVAFAKPFLLQKYFLLIYIVGFLIGLTSLVLNFLLEVLKNDKIVVKI